MGDCKLTDGKSPVLFTVDGYQLVVMPMLTSESQKPKEEAKAEATNTATKPEATKQKPVADKAEPKKPKHS